MTIQIETGRGAGKRVTKGTSAEAQRARILDWLRRRPLDSIDCYVLLGALHPARRVMELRRAGHPITTQWIWRAGPEGQPHRVAMYVLEAS